jgi:hypothetical protein
VLDEVEEDGLEKKMREEIGLSLSQARKQAKDAQRARGKARQAEAT